MLSTAPEPLAYYIRALNYNPKVLNYDMKVLACYTKVLNYDMKLLKLPAYRKGALRSPSPPATHLKVLR